MPVNKPDIESIKQVKIYRIQGLSYRQIAKKMDKPLKAVYRWDKYDLKKLSPAV